MWTLMKTSLRIWNDLPSQNMLLKYNSGISDFCLGELVKNFLFRKYRQIVYFLILFFYFSFGLDFVTLKSPRRDLSKFYCNKGLQDELCLGSAGRITLSFVHGMLSGQREVVRIIQF